jgi:hypothetical protein
MVSWLCFAGGCGTPSASKPKQSEPSAHPEQASAADGNASGASSAGEPRLGPVLTTSMQVHPAAALRDLYQCSGDAPEIVDGYATGLSQCAEGTLHRPAPVLCPLSAGQTLPEGAGLCLSDADCSAGEACNCVVIEYLDQQHVPSGVLQFGGRCQPASCHADSDCGAGLLCVQVAQHSAGSPGGCSGPTPAFACQTRQDGCAAAQDCALDLLCLSEAGRLDCLYAATTCQ